MLTAHFFKEDVVKYWKIKGRQRIEKKQNAPQKKDLFARKRSPQTNPPSPKEKNIVPRKINKIGPYIFRLKMR